MFATASSHGSPGILVLGLFLATLAVELGTMQCARASDRKHDHWVYTVRPGDNLWDLSEKYLVDMRYWRRVQALNQITSPRQMPPGTQVRFPIAWLRKEPATVQVIAVNGAAEATLGSTRQTIPLTAGTYLRAGDAIRTGSDGSITLRFVDGSMLLLKADGSLLLETVDRYGDTGLADTKLRLERGDVENQVAPRGNPGTRYEIRTPAAVSSVRGTDYRMSMQPAKTLSRVETLEGSVGVGGAGRTRLLSGGFGTVVKTGKPPIRPVKLLPAPDVSQLPTTLERVPIRFELPPVEGAASYRMQISDSFKFQILLADSVSRSPLLVGPDLPDGSYAARFRGIDHLGLEGRDAYHEFILNARPEPPVLIAPAPDRKVRMTRPLFEWSEPENASGYDLQLADNADFRAPILTLSNHESARFTPDRELAAGQYYWRVATRTDSGDVGPYGDPQGFVLRPAPESPVAEEPEVQKNALVLRWSAGAPGQRYRFQLARDWRFATLLEDKTLTEPQIILPRLESGVYYLRIKTIDVDGYAGPFGPGQRITVRPTTYWPFVVMPIIIMLLLL